MSIENIKDKILDNIFLNGYSNISSSDREILNLLMSDNIVEMGDIIIQNNKGQSLRNAISEFEEDNPGVFEKDVIASANNNRTF